ncbi:hypothetical protein AX16_000507 [Volvariella volvacea WC 439]|nr:hypothetical protein AX16_000507 [Volvariella volvacea WC 439]
MSLRFRASPWVSYEPNLSTSTSTSSSSPLTQLRPTHSQQSRPAAATSVIPSRSGPSSAAPIMTTINTRIEDDSMDMDAPQISILRDEETPPPQPKSTSGSRRSKASAAPKHPSWARPPIRKESVSEDELNEEPEEEEDQLIDDDDDELMKPVPPTALQNPAGRAAAAATISAGGGGASVSAASAAGAAATTIEGTAGGQKRKAPAKRKPRKSEKKNADEDSASNTRKKEKEKEKEKEKGRGKEKEQKDAHAPPLANQEASAPDQQSQQAPSIGLTTPAEPGKEPTSVLTSTQQPLTPSKKTSRKGKDKEGKEKEKEQSSTNGQSLANRSSGEQDATAQEKQSPAIVVTEPAESSQPAPPRKGPPSWLVEAQAQQAAAAAAAAVPKKSASAPVKRKARAPAKSKLSAVVQIADDAASEAPSGTVPSSPITNGMDIDSTRIGPELDRDSPKDGELGETGAAPSASAAVGALPPEEVINLENVPQPLYPLPTKPFPVQPPPKIPTGFAPLMPLDKSKKKTRHWRTAQREIRGIAGGRWFIRTWVGNKESEYAAYQAAAAAMSHKDKDDKLPGVALPKLLSMSASASVGKSRSRGSKAATAGVGGSSGHGSTGASAAPSRDGSAIPPDAPQGLAQTNVTSASATGASRGPTKMREVLQLAPSESEDVEMATAPPA